MTGAMARTTDDHANTPMGCALEAHQLAAVAEPRRPTRELARPEPSGSFQDLETLLQQLGTPQIMELGNPLPFENFMPRRRVGNCPAAHNRALLGGQDN